MSKRYPTQWKTRFALWPTQVGTREGKANYTWLRFYKVRETSYECWEIASGRAGVENYKFTTMPL